MVLDLSISIIVFLIFIIGTMILSNKLEILDFPSIILGEIGIIALDIILWLKTFGVINISYKQIFIGIGTILLITLFLVAIFFILLGDDESVTIGAGCLFAFMIIAFVGIFFIVDEDKEVQTSETSSIILEVSYDT